MASAQTWQEATHEHRQSRLKLINDLAVALRDCRERAAWNLRNPGNEHDTLEEIITLVTNVLRDGPYDWMEEDEDED